MQNYEKVFLVNIPLSVSDKRKDEPYMKIFDFQYFLNSFGVCMPYLLVTLEILVISLFFSLLFGMFFAWCKLRKNHVVRILANTYTEIIRGTPFIVLLFIIYFGIPKFMLSVMNISMDGVTKSVYIIVTLAMFGSARMSEAMRAAYLAVPSGQMEAALSVGISPVQSFLSIVFPQALLIAIPNMGNLILSNLLETAVGFSIGIVDFVGNARLVITRDYGVHSLEIYCIVALVYWCMSMIMSKGFDLLESWLKKKQGLNPVRYGKNGRKGVAKHA